MYVQLFFKYSNFYIVNRLSWISCEKNKEAYSCVKKRL